MRWRFFSRNWFFSAIAAVLLLFALAQTLEQFVAPELFRWWGEAEAASGTVDPNGDIGTNTATLVTCASGTLRYTCFDDAVRDPSTPATGSDYAEYAGGNQTDSDLTTLTGVATVTAVAVKTYHRETGTNVTMAVLLVNAAGTTIAGPTNLTNRGTSQWDTVTFSGLSLSQATLDGLRIRVTCTRAGGAAGSRCQNFAMYADITYDPVINVTVSATGTQQNVTASTTAHFGGAFAIVGNVGTRNITSITVAEAGTIDAATNLKNVRLRYDLDQTNPYNCGDQTYSSGDTTFGSVDADGFSAANGTSTFTGSVGISPTTTMCVYVEADILSTANASDTIEIQITSPQTDVVGSGSPVISPSSTVAIAGTTVVQKVVLEQVHYHWRDDNGSETTASSTTGGTENTANTDFPKGVPQRLRLAVSNEGNATSSAVQYRLEYGAKVSTCAAISTWIDVGAAGGAFDMVNSSNLTDGTDTTNIAVANGGVSDPNPTFLTPNGGVKDTSSQTSGITLTATQFVELEYSISATTTLSDGASYCFRVTNAGTELQTYTRYAELTIGADLKLAAVGNQVALLTASTTDQYLGGAFRVTNNTGDTDVLTSITITASGTSNVQTSLSTIHLHYDLDTTAPYDCGDQSYSASDPTYGSSVSAFNGSKKAAFTGSATTTNTQAVCLYVAFDVATSAVNNTTLEVFIASPSSEIVAGGATIAPASQVDIASTTLFAQSVLEQTGYHWRNNNGSESGATSATGGSENTALTETVKDSIYRLRMAVSNEGLATSTGAQYRLEWAQKFTTCSAATSWTRVDTASDAWEIAPNANLTDGNDTTNIAVATGGVTDPNPTFLTPNGGQKDASDTTSGITLSPTQFVEIEYSIRATTLSAQGATYCFRVTNASTTLTTYTQYPEAQIKLDTDFKIQRNFVIMTGTTATITAGVDYEAPASTTRAFIRITNTQHTGGGPDTTGNLFANDVTVYIANPENIGTSINFSRTSAAVNTRVYWEIIEYRGATGGENEIVVRQQEALSIANGTASVNSGTISGVASTSKLVVFVTGQHNQDTGRNNYGAGLFTGSYSTSSNQVVLTRGATGAAGNVSYALVEFVGSRWKIQRIAHTYSAAGTTQTQTIPQTVNSLARTFVHVQKQLSGTNVNHADLGHEVWLSGVGQVSFLLDAGAGTPANHTAVAWVIENTQTTGARMVVTRSNNILPTSASANQSNYVSIGKTLSDQSIASLFVTNRSDETTRTWPEPIIGVTLASSTHYLLWRSNASANVNYRTEVVEWPTAARVLTQNYYRLYVNNNAITPSDPWPVGATNLAENAEMTASSSPVAAGDVIRIRMSIKVSAAALPATLDSFILQYAKRTTTCTAATNWKDLGGIGSTTAEWRGFNASSTDGTALSTATPPPGDLLLSVSTVAGTYEEENSTAVNPYIAYPDDQIEYDWVVQHNGASDKSSYCFRMTEVDGTEFSSYVNYPVLRTVGFEPKIGNWRWYDDETSLTPTSGLGTGINVAPIDIANQNSIKLRVVLSEVSGAAATSTKFAVQYSQYPDFGRDVFAVVASSSCQGNSIWCYADGAGVDNATITSAVLPGADTCSGGVGAGCGTHNEGTTTVSSVLQSAFSNAEYEFTIKHAGARANGVYYFRLYDLVRNEAVAASSSYPSLVTEGPSLVFGVTGLPSGTTTAGVTTNVTADSSAINFGNMQIGTNYIAAHRVSVTTNATEGYRVLTYVPQQLMNTYGQTIPAIAATNASPASWASQCTASSTGCAGYHTTDSTLLGGSTRFAAVDTYAGLHTSPAEIMYSSLPAADTHDVVYRVWVGQLQSAGDYQTEIIYLAIPTF